MTSPADEVRNLMKRYPSNPARTKAALDAAFREPTGTEIAAAARDTLMADWSPEDRAGALNALAADLAEGGSVSVYVTRDDEDGEQR